MENFRCATKTDTPLLACLREKVWKETYEGIYPKEMLDSFDRTLHEKSSTAKSLHRTPLCISWSLMIPPLGTSPLEDPENKKKGPRISCFTPYIFCPAIRAEASEKESSVSSEHTVKTIS